MDIRKIPVEKINPSPYNPRIDLQPGDPEYEKLRRSIEEFGYVEPLVWNERTGNLVGGHQRLKILLEQGHTEIEVSVVNLDDAREKALNIALNKISGEFDIPKLQDLLAELDVSGIDVALTGFDEEELTDILSSISTLDDGTEVEIEEDDFDVEEALASIEKPITRPGDIWILGNHRLICGDSTNITDIKKLMDGKKANMVHTDPPYGVSYEGGTKKWDMIENDHLENDDLLHFLDSVYCNISQVIEKECSLYIWYAGTMAPEFIVPARKYFEISYTIIWNKNHAQFGNMGSHYKTKHELCLYMKPKGGKHSWYGPKNEVTVWDIDRAMRNEYHPTQKPIPLCVRPIQNSSKRGNIILDLFGGSGSTLIAAEKTGRIAYLCELDPKYCDVIVQRWENETGQTAKRISET